VTASHAEGHQPTLRTLLVMPLDHKRGGVVSVVDNLARHLQGAGHEVLFFHNRGLPILRNRVTQLGYPGVQLRLSLPFGPGIRSIPRTLAFPFLFCCSLLQLLWLLRSRRIDIVNLHYPNEYVVYFAICRRLMAIRLVTSIHGRDAFYHERPKERYSWAFKFIIRSSDLIVLPSDSYRRKFLEAFPDAREHTIYIHNGIDTGLFNANSCNTVSARPENNRYMLCVAELKEYKAIDVLLRAAKPIVEGDPSLTLVLAGDGPMRGELEALATSLGIRQQTMFLGTQGASEVARLLRGSEMLVLPSREEPFGIVLIEAMACRTPVVATRVGGIPEIIEHEVTGILVEPEDSLALTAALCRVWNDDALRKTIAENGHARVMERFCSSHNGVAYLKAFGQLKRLGSVA
jgi:L-malate glycosyltransferase